jgi:hypothetical protein
MTPEDIFGYPNNKKWGLRYPINKKTGKRTRPDLIPVSNHAMKTWFEGHKRAHPLNSSMMLNYNRNFVKYPSKENILKNKKQRSAAVIQRAFRAKKKYPTVYVNKKNIVLISKFNGFIPIKGKFFITSSNKYT